jgi:hypothetical protein
MGLGNRDWGIGVRGQGKGVRRRGIGNGMVADGGPVEERANVLAIAKAVMG